MMSQFTVKMWSREHLQTSLADYISVSADVSPWTAENFLKDLPGKWELSFGIWHDRPIAYCVMSFREGGIHIHQFMVARQYRGRGVGEYMLTAAFRIASARARSITLKVPTPNAGAQRFYVRYGFIAVGHDEAHVLMSRQLQN